MCNRAVYIEIAAGLSSSKLYLVKISSLCILRLSAIGDVCHAVAMVERIQRHAPDIQITWIIGKLEHQLVGDIEGVEFVIFDKQKGKQAYKDLSRSIKGRRFDVLFAMQVAFRANWAARKIKAKTKIGFDWERSKELHWLVTNKRVEAQKHPHVLDGFMAFADAIGIPKDQQVRWHIPISEEVMSWSRQATHNLDKYAVICPAASNPDRNWLPQRYAEVVDYLSSKGISVILCGGPGPVDKELGEKIEQFSRRVAKNLIGQTSLKQLLAVLKGAELVVAPDTGPAHMATTVGTPVVGLYAHSNPLRTGPYNSLGYVVSTYDKHIKKQKGAEWQTLKWGTRAKGKNLMASINSKDVFHKIDNVLSR